MQKKWIAIAALIFASAGQAFAQDDESQEGVYFGAGIGDFSSELNQLNGTSIDFDEDESAYKAFVGWRFNQFLAAQVDYLDLGRSDSTVGLDNLEVKTRGYVARIEGTLPLAFVELFATAGLMFSSVDANLGETEVLDESDNDPVYSVGAGIEVAERLVLRLEYEIIDIETFDDAEAIWLSAAWRL
jgi:opacity protein-like surface antigen